ncbi:MAG: S16 family serine protease, partial [Rikenellaceae bacterium]
DADFFESHDIHIHVPEGAIPKDGPSAGITMVTSLVSLLSNRKVKERLAMTGETTLRGKVLPVGGLKEKLLAAKRAGITDVIVSEENEKDILDINKNYLSGITVHYVATLHDVLEKALLQS